MNKTNIGVAACVLAVVAGVALMLYNKKDNTTIRVVAPSAALSTTRDPHEIANERWAACIDALAARVEPTAIANSDEILARLVDAHEADKRSYGVELRRWGDFIEIGASRGGVKYATALNVGATREIRVVEGHPPDGDGFIKFDAEPAEPGDEFCTWWDSESHASKITIKSAVIPMAPRDHVIMKMDKTGDQPGQTMSTRCSYVSDPWPTCHLSISSTTSVTSMINPFVRRPPNKFPRIAEDDLVRFEGIGAELHAPAGLGGITRDAVLREVGR